MTLGEFSLVLSFAGALPYLVKIWRNEIKPERGSWFVWSAILALSIWGYQTLGAGDSLWFLVGDFVVTFAIFLSSLIKGRGGITRFDLECIAMALMGLVIWQVASRPIWMLVGTVIADVMGTIMTIKATLDEPTAESSVTFGFTALAAILGLLAVKEWNLQLLFYPFYLFLANFTVAVVIMVSQYLAQHWHKGSVVKC